MVVRSPEYFTWVGMRNRCRTKPRYIKQGIKVCERWDSFAAFLEDMGPKPTPKHTIDRKDNTKGYEPDNCRWATMREQQNNRRNNVVLTFNGESRSITEWARKLGVTHATLKHRFNRGWPVEAILTRPKIRYAEPERAREFGFDVRV